MNRIAGFAALAVVVLAASASAGDYPDAPDVRVAVADRVYQVRLHPSQPRLLIRRDWYARVEARGEAELVGGTDANPPMPDWRAAAWALTTQYGCSVGRETATRAGEWEVGFRCPSHVDLRRMARSQDPAWKPVLWVSDPYGPEGLTTSQPDRCAREATFQRQLACRDSRNAVLRPDPRRKPTAQDRPN